MKTPKAVTIDFGRLGDERVRGNAVDIIDDASFRISERLPLDETALMAARPALHIQVRVALKETDSEKEEASTEVNERVRLDGLGQERVHNVVVEEQHSAIRVVDDEILGCAQKTGRDDLKDERFSKCKSKEYNARTSERIASSVARPPAFLITCASPSAKPAKAAGLSLASMQVSTAK